MTAAPGAGDDEPVTSQTTTGSDAQARDTTIEDVLDRRAPEAGGAAVEGQAGDAQGAEDADRHRAVPRSAAFRRFIADGWGPRPAQDLDAAPWAPYAARRREVLSSLFPGELLVVPAGTLVRRSNDTDYRFRPHSAFAHLTGLGTDQEPDAVLVLHPDGDAHRAVLYVRPQAGRDTEEFFADARYGELWVGPRPTLEAFSARTGLAVHDVAALTGDLTSSLASAKGSRVLTEADAGVTSALAALRGPVPDRADDEFATALSELRLVKDEYEVGQLREAVAASARGFEEIVRALPRAVGHPRGERVVEAAFDGNARVDGNAVGYETISAAGDHACTLHWIRNDGPVEAGQLLLVDAGVEVDSLYTADVTRTLPVDGTFTEPQRRVYQAVLDAAEAAFAVARPGVRFREVHEAAMRVVAERLEAWGMLPVDAATSLLPEGQFHRRWMPHGTSHHLGLDVHDCAQARKEMYLDAELREGMVFTIEPGIYIKTEDELAPAELRGIGVRIEDDVLVTADGVENLTAGLPRTPDAVEAWMASLR